MSIKLKNRAEFEDTDAGVAGTVATTSIAGIEMIAFPCILKGMLARLGTAGGTQATIVDIQKSAQGGAFTSIFSGATKINFATSSQTPTYGALTTNPTTFLKGDLVKIVVTQAGSVPAPADLGVALNFQRFKGSGVSATTQTDTVGADAEF
jgi:hypothetical protein